MSIRRMNGKPLKYHGFADFDDPRRAIGIGHHTSLEAFEGAMRRGTIGGRCLYGWVWVEYREGEEKGVLNVNPIIIHEGIMTPHRAWKTARHRAVREQTILVPFETEAECCATAAGYIEVHQKTVRHFRYWCMKFPELTLRAFPWMKELLAEETLTCQERE